MRCTVETRMPKGQQLPRPARNGEKPATARSLPVGLQMLRPPFQRDQILLQCGGPRFRLLGVLPLGVLRVWVRIARCLASHFNLLHSHEPSAVRSEAAVSPAPNFQSAVACTAVPAAQARTTRRLTSLQDYWRTRPARTAQVRTAAPAAAAAAARLHHATCTRWMALPRPEPWAW